MYVKMEMYRYTMHLIVGKSILMHTHMNRSRGFIEHQQAQKSLNGDIGMHHVKKCPLRNTIKDSSTIMCSPLPECNIIM